MDQAVEKLGLNERDKAALQHANRKAMMYVFGGGWAGAMLGATFAFRPLQKGLVLYDAAAADAATASVYMRRLFFRGFVWSLFGGILGLQVGTSLGAKAAIGIIRKEGDEQEIKRSIKAALDTAVRERQQAMPGGAARGAPRTVASSSDPYMTNNNPDDIQDRGNDDSFFSGTSAAANDGQGPSTSFDTQDGQSPRRPSRWDELRKAQASPPSRWDIIREENARRDLPAGVSQQQQHQLGQRRPGRTDETLDELSASTNSSGGGSQDLSYEERRRRFDEMMQLEASGGNDSDPAGNRKWT